MRTGKRKRQHLYQEREKNQENWPHSPWCLIGQNWVTGSSIGVRMAGKWRYLVGQIDTWPKSKFWLVRGKKKNGHLVDNYKVSRNPFSENNLALTSIYYVCAYMYEQLFTCKVCVHVCGCFSWAYLGVWTSVSDKSEFQFLSTTYWPYNIREVTLPLHISYSWDYNNTYFMEFENKKDNICKTLGIALETQ